MNIVWKYIEQTVKTVNIGPMDVVDMEQKHMQKLLQEPLVLLLLLMVAQDITQQDHPRLRSANQVELELVLDTLLGQQQVSQELVLQDLLPISS